jgi:hypothetical protein
VVLVGRQVMIVLEVPEGVSRVHASRRLFNFLKVLPPAVTSCCVTVLPEQERTGAAQRRLCGVVP